MEEIMKQSIGIKPVVFPNPVFVVGTYDDAGKPNVLTIAWSGIAGSDPASIAIAVRPGRYSYENILKRKAFTVNIPSSDYVAEADFFGIASGRDTDKLGKTGLTAVRGDFVDAPFVKEFPYNIECALTHTLDLGSHTLFVGEIKDIKADESLLDEKGNPQWEKAGVLTYDGALSKYRIPGDVVADAFSIGVPLMKKSR
jgi:flavin reductase (DIM6/NTAB) family NADH-FMN oxidoreductase RutF